jgi:hypothetical protein
MTAPRTAALEPEIPGQFYLGRVYDLSHAARGERSLQYDARDLTTHALCVGMTGSGKTGLCIALLEEAALDGIPAIVVDPKGDLSNLLLTFPELRASDFAPWLDPSDAERQHLSIDDYAERVAQTWREGLADWGQDGSRIARLRQSVDLAVYTPGSSSGLPLTVLRSFVAPPITVRQDPDALREQVATAVGGLLALLGVSADPLSSREHILLSTIVEQRWSRGESLTLPDLIGQIQVPGFDRVGVIDLESFLPLADRTALAMRLNNLLASPSFAPWLAGEPLEIQRLLRTPEGKPRLSILSIAHLGESERMFFVTILLNELVGWMRSQSGTSSLRAIFYMDEVFGYFPPSAVPPSKPPMLTLLKQARAYGLGIVLATQNPVDLDYKGLANIGTWFLGRLQTDRDKQRVLDGLEGAIAGRGQSFDRGQLDRILSGLEKRVFLMNNVHETEPIVFQSRWALSYLRGPLTRPQIAQLMQDHRRADRSSTAAADGSSPASTVPGATAAANVSRAARGGSGGTHGPRPFVPAEIEQRFLGPQQAIEPNSTYTYYPMLLGRGTLHYTAVKARVDTWTDVGRIADVRNGVRAGFWEQSTAAPEPLMLHTEPPGDWPYADLPSALLNAKNYNGWLKEFKEYLYRSQSLSIFYCPALKQFAPAGLDELSARLALEGAAREARDQQRDRVRQSLEKKLDALERRVRAAKDRLQREQSQYDAVKYDSVLVLGRTVLGSVLGRRRSGALGGTASAARSASRAAQQKSDVARAEEGLEGLRRERELLELESELAQQKLAEQFDVRALSLETQALTPRKSDLRAEPLVLLWVPESPA